MNFKAFADKVNAKFLLMAQQPELFVVNVSKEELWETYLESYPDDYNQIFRERRTHDCQTCASFVKRLGKVVTSQNNQLDSIWNVEGLEYPYDVVAKAMHELVISHAISNVFRSSEALAGKEYNIEANEAGPIRWEHFYADIDQAFVTQEVASTVGEISTIVGVYKRALDEFSIEALESTIELCDEIYRGAEFKQTVLNFLDFKVAYEKSGQSQYFAWNTYRQAPAKIRNSAIGTLIIDINEGTDLEEAVAKYEKVVAPENYKRTTAVVTERMKQDAIKTIDELGMRDSLPRRHARLEDISVANVLYASASAQTVMKDPLLEAMGGNDAAISIPSNPIKVDVDRFFSTILPNSSKIEALVENRHLSNFVSLVAPVNPDAPNMLKWDNNFSWSYKGEVTDSMKERVKAAGGSITGDLRFSIQWNEEGTEGSNDLDAHCSSPLSHIYYGDKRGRCGGQLDVDITDPNSQTKDGIAVENITWDCVQDMVDGTYTFAVNNFARTNTTGFRAEIEMLGEVFQFDYSKALRTKETIEVATITLKDGKFTINCNLNSSSAAKTEWDVTTQQFQEVSTIMLSPNHWDDKAIGNKHFFFMLEGCKNPDQVRGFYNEFLNEDLRKHRKVFEVLSSNMKCAPDDHQLSGLGFSSTQRNTLIVKVDNVPYEIQF